MEDLIVILMVVPSSFTHCAGNLSTGTNSEKLEDYFSKYGKITKVWVARKPAGFGKAQLYYSDPLSTPVEFITFSDHFFNLSSFWYLSSAYVEFETSKQAEEALDGSKGNAHGWKVEFAKRESGNQGPRNRGRDR